MLPKYTGPFTPTEAAHLLRRATFGPRRADIDRAVALGLEGTIDLLFDDRPPPEPPLVIARLDGGAAVGETWVDKPYGAENLMRSVVARIASLFGWLASEIISEDFGGHQKLLLFWHNHFAINTAVEPKYNYRYLTTLRTHMLGSFRQLVKEINVDPLMLTFLNGNQNRALAPNENYARELLELFTIGKGPQVGPDDYTHYTEQDVREMARALTGWVDYGFNATDTGEFGSRFVARRHDPTPITLSHRFGNATLNLDGERAHEQLTDFILERDEVARFIVRKLYRWYVYYAIDETVEANVIEPLAELFRTSDYQIRPVLKALLGSAHFFAREQRGPQIKNPFDFVVGTLRGVDYYLPPGLNAAQRYRTATPLLQVTRDLGMTHFTPPNVAGWKAYYQAPLYYRLWINSATLPIRQQLVEQLTTVGLPINERQSIRPELLPLVEQFDEPSELHGVLDGFALLFFPLPLTDGQRQYLRDQLLPGLPDTQWTVEYVQLRANPNDAALAAALETKLRRTVRAMMEMPEYQLA